MRTPRLHWHLSVLTTFLSAAVLASSAPAAEPTGTRSTLPFDATWSFSKGDAPSAEQPSFDDSTWQTVTLPHDWSIAGPFDQSNPSTGAGAFLPDGISWYRKHFTLPADADARRVFIDFDGVMANSDVWINGVHLGKRPYGYVGFRYELTGHLQFGDSAQNLLAVRTDNAQQPASRWYSGAGIYRHVRLITTDPVHLDTFGTFVSTPEITSEKASVRIQNKIVNQSDAPRTVAVKVTLLDPSSKEVASLETSPVSIPAGQSQTVDQTIAIAPQLWDLDHPNIYHAFTEVRADNKTLDDSSTPFGIRNAEFRADTGFWLNGVNMKLKGVCLHHEAGGVGAAVPLAVWEHRLAALKEIGCNAIRTAHNPPSPEFLDLCDRMGFLVMDEMFDCWTVAKNPYDYHLYFKDWSLIDTRDTVLRDRNHPSIILYSAGNEIHDTPKHDIALPILKSLVATFHENDPTRPVTQALFRPNVSHDYDDGLADMLDVVGTNYRDKELLKAHDDKPTRKIVGTEFGPSLDAWASVRDHPAYAGYFLWTGADYLGESRRWPNVIHESGLIDITDTPHAIGYQFQSWWSDQPMVAIVRDQGAISTGNIPGEPQTRVRQAIDWSPQNTQPHSEKVLVYSNCDKVELFLNGTSLGSKNAPADQSPRTWSVDFQPGELKAVGTNKGQNAAEFALRTAGKPAKIALNVDRDTLTPTWDDVAFVTATVVDDHDIPVPAAKDDITFAITGPGTIAALENTDPTSHEPFQAMHRHAYQGRCVALIKASDIGSITLGATAEGLTASSISMKAVRP